MLLIILFFIIGIIYFIVRFKNRKKYIIYKTKEVKPVYKVSTCDHAPTEAVSQVHALGSVFPSQGGMGYLKNCTKCGCWLICECKRDWFMKFMPNYIEKLQESKDKVAFCPNVCEACLGIKERLNLFQKLDKTEKVIEYIYYNDDEFFDYCYGRPISGFEKDMNVRYGNASEKERAEAEIRQQKAKKLLNYYIFGTKDE